jgi:hypothetical protein
MVTCTEIRALVSAAALRDRNDGLPAPDWAKLAEKHPEAFRRVVDSDGRVKAAAIRRGWIRDDFADELGRALWLANADSIIARYPSTEEQPGDGLTRYPDQWPDGETFASVLAYRHALVERPIVELIKALHHFDYQACEPDDYAGSWCSKFVEGLEAILVRALPGYEAAPYGIADPEDGPPEPATAGAPISILSMMPGGSNSGRRAR